MNYTDLEKERLRLKICWEGGLEHYIEYGVARTLYLKFQKEFDNLELHKCIKKQKKLYNQLLGDLETSIENYLNERETSQDYTDDELNSVDYILD